jgi:hypothetical protein
VIVLCAVGGGNIDFELTGAANSRCVNFVGEILMRLSKSYPGDTSIHRRGGKRRCKTQEKGNIRCATPSTRAVGMVLLIGWLVYATNEK